MQYIANLIIQEKDGQITAARAHQFGSPSNLFPGKIKEQE
jgi:hypothetical protein